MDDQICTKDDKVGYAATVGDAMAAVAKVRRAGGTQAAHLLPQAQPPSRDIGRGTQCCPMVACRRQPKQSSKRAYAFPRARPSPAPAT